MARVGDAPPKEGHGDTEKPQDHVVRKVPVPALRDWERPCSASTSRRGRCTCSTPTGPLCTARQCGLETVWRSDQPGPPCQLGTSTAHRTISAVVWIYHQRNQVLNEEGRSPVQQLMAVSEVVRRMGAPQSSCKGYSLFMAAALQQGKGILE